MILSQFTFSSEGTEYCIENFTEDNYKIRCSEFISTSYFEEDAFKMCNDPEFKTDDSKIWCLESIKDKVFHSEKMKLALNLSSKTKAVNYLKDKGVEYKKPIVHMCSKKYQDSIYEKTGYRESIYVDSAGGWAAYSASLMIFPVFISKELKISSNNAALEDHQEVLHLLKTATGGYENIEIYDLLEDVNNEAETEQTLDQLRGIIVNIDRFGQICNSEDELADYDGLLEKILEVLILREK